jgi:[acyl-carrier-protein] S-malonyltransferase
VTAKQTSDPQEIKKLLIEQITGSVRWRESVLYMKEQNVDTQIEIGQGKVLTGLARKIDREIKTESINLPKDIENFLANL